MTDNRTSTEKAIQRTDDALSRCQMELTSAIENLRQATVQENYQRDSVRELSHDREGETMKWWKCEKCKDPCYWVSRGNWRPTECTTRYGHRAAWVECSPAPHEPVNRNSLSCDEPQGGESERNQK